MSRDLRYAIRLLLRSPLFTSVAALSLAIGIGGAASVFAVLNAVVLRSLPISNPQQLYLAEKHLAEEVSPRYSWVLFEQARDEVKGRAELFAATNATSMNVRIAGRTDPGCGRARVGAAGVGRVFWRPETERSERAADRAERQHCGGESRCAVISDAFWDRRFRRAGDVVGRELIIGGAHITIIGVANARVFRSFPRRTQSGSVGAADAAARHPLCVQRQFVGPVGQPEAVAAAGGDRVAAHVRPCAAKALTCPRWRPL